jgi:aspartyl-tRNA(Asn)/glutamyl-tRNA(Gln) amidotransferase subunit B
MSKYEVVIGIETHVQLATKSKLFCGCNNDSRDAEPNTHVCPVCLGLPGALPVLNEAAVKLALQAGHALNAYQDGVEFHTKFDRKNYFYPDSPMNYQITQFDEPIIGNGYAEFPVDGEMKRVGITRAHLEADAGKLVHPAHADYSLVDLNRAGTPLLEIVSEPDIRSAAEAKAYAQELYNLMRYAKVSDANLYYGNMRFDVNVSLRPAGSSEFGTRTESKNLNSFRAVSGVVEYEMKRQAEILDHGEKVMQETRGWDENKNVTFSQRNKEEAHDYRYFPEPDLPPLVITKGMLNKARKDVGNLPSDVRILLGNYAISASIKDKLIAEPLAVEIVVEASKIAPMSQVQQICSWIATYPDDELQKFLGSWSEFLSARSASEVKYLAMRLVDVANLTTNGKLSSSGSKVLFNYILRSFQVDKKLQSISDLKPTEQIAQEEGQIQVSDANTLEAIVDQVIADNPKPVADYKAGEAKALGFLVGQVMKVSKGQANPPMVNDILKKKLGD